MGTYAAVTHPVVAACVEYLMADGYIPGLAQAGAACARLGFDAIEVPVASLVEERRPITNVPPVVGVHNVLPYRYELFTDELVSKSFDGLISSAIRAARLAHAPVVTIGIGSARRVPPGRSRAWAAQALVEALAGHERESVEANVRLAIEVISSRTAQFLTTVAETRELILRTRAATLGITVDTYQAFSEGLDPSAEIRRAGDRLVHVQIAGRGRTPPARETIDASGLIMAMQEVTYAGALSVELKADAGEQQREQKLGSSLAYLRQSLASV